MDELEELLSSKSGGQTLEAWVVAQCNEWRDHLEANYYKKWDEYYRIWRGVWASEDKTRSSERSKLISPATQQAVESSVSDLEEATFGRGSFFDVDAEIGGDPQSTETLKQRLAKKFREHGVRKDTSEVLINAAVFGTGIGEIVVDSYTKYTPVETEDDGMMVYGRQEEEEVCVKLRPIHPKNFRIPDTATCVEDAIGVGIEELVAPDYVFTMQEQGIYKTTDVLLESYAADDDLDLTQQLPATATTK